MMPEEKNKATLHRALRELPQYEPPDTIWMAVEDLLAQGEDGEHLRASLRLLPSYEPPREVWAHIEEELQADASGKPGGIRRLVSYWKPVAAAASVLILIGIGWGLLSDDGAPEVTIVESQSVIPAQIMEQDWNSDETVFRQVLENFGEHPLLARNPQIKNLKEELEELSDAKSAIENMMERYGNDPALIRRMGEIERERSEVIKEMATFI